MKSSFVSALIVLVSFALPACGGGADDSDSTNDALRDEASARVTITDADKEAVAKGEKLYLKDPKVSEHAVFELVSHDSWDGTHNKKWVIKDTDKRLFSTTQVTSGGDDSPNGGRHGSPPRLQLTDTAILLDDIGIDYVIANHARKQSKRHKQILGYKNNPDFPETYKEIGTRTIDGSPRTLIPFAGMLFAVKAEGFDARCKTSEEVPACAAAWERVDNIGRGDFLDVDFR